MRSIVTAGVLLGLALPAGARQIQEVGTATTFDVATWNIEWFGSTGGGPTDEARQLQNAADVIGQAGIDLWAVQEVASSVAFADLLSLLGPAWEGELATSSGDGSQRIGFLYRTDVVRKRSSGHILVQFDSLFAGRPPLRLEVDVTLPDTALTVVLVTVHMKAFDDVASYEKRVAAAGRLKNHFDISERSANLVWLGDLNDELLSSITAGQPSPYAAFVADSEDYRFLSMPLEIAGECTFCGSSYASTIDHILVSDELFRAADAGMTDRLDAVIAGFPGFLSTTSDHVPVYTRLLPEASSIPVESVPAAGRLEVYPVPARGHVTVTLGRAAPGPVRIRIVDLLGRERSGAVIEAGDRTVTIDVSTLAPGPYLLVTPDGSRLLPVVR
jgi:endonuclease/exonuclease/phosphatase family metal-dependent hydrolase